MKTLTTKELQQVKSLLNSSDENNWGLACQLMKGCQNLTATFLTELFIQAFFAKKIKTRSAYQSVLQEVAPDLFLLGNNKFTYWDKNQQGALDVRVPEFYNNLRKVALHPQINWRTVFFYFKNLKGGTLAYQLPNVVFLLGLEFSLINSSYIQERRHMKLNSPTMTTIPKELSQLPDLKMLEIEKTAIKKLYPQLGRLKFLDSLSIANNPLKEEEIAKNTFQKLQLESIRMNNCQLKGLPQLWEALANCSSLEYLSLADNHLEQIPAVIAKLKKLEQLDISGNLSLSTDKISPLLFELPNFKKLSPGARAEYPDEFIELIFTKNQQIDLTFNESSAFRWGLQCSGDPKKSSKVKGLTLDDPLEDDWWGDDF